MGQRYAGVLGLLAFVVVVARGLLHQGGLESTLWTAAINMFVFAALGYVLGQFAGWIVWDSVRASVASEVATGNDATSAGSQV